GRALLDLVGALAGAADVDAAYDAAARRLRVTLRYPGSARDFEAALWEAIPRRRLWHAIAGPPFSRALSPERREGNVVRLAFGGAPAAAVLIIEAAASDADAFHACGAGCFVSPRGLVLTSARAVEGASALRVRLADGRTVAAVLVATDSTGRTATLRVQ